MVMEALTELSRLAESQLPANPRSARNDRAAVELERKLQKYFKALEAAISEGMIKRLYGNPT